MPTEELIVDARRVVDELGPESQALALRRDQLQAEEASLTRYQATLRKLLPLAGEIPQLDGYETVALLIERRASGVLDLVRQQLGELLGDRFELNARHVDDQTTAAIVVFPKEQSARVNALLGRENISPLRLPQELARVSLTETLATMERRLAEIPREMARVDDELRELGRSWGSTVALLRAVLTDRLRQMDVIGLVGATRYTFVLAGWIARRDVKKLKDTLAQEVGHELLVEELRVSGEELKQVPVALANPPPVRPFEFLVRLIALPRYGALDPTPLLAFFMPIFFGVILGDIAYGILLLLLAGLVLRTSRRPVYRSIGQVLLLCGFWSVLFGVLFGEFLGALGHQLFGLKPVWMERSGATLKALFVFALAVGGVHVVLGFVLGIWEAFRIRSHKELSERLGKFIALIAVFWLVAIVAGKLPRDLTTPGTVALIIGIVLLSVPMGWLGGLLGPIETLGLVSNVLSYLRLAAIGLASFYLAEVANRLYGISTDVAIGTVVAALLHALNLAIGIVSASIQSLRLHYVEFFTKFYESGGSPFRPFKQSGV
ncbi:MAG TPA: V-type ATPase 116kDa subunit family protein [Candidatus Acidoferrales bacterium]|nr:V-type ATPase 116kDa subunit family protein [Candidatus Acidoferrales bacterium]